MTTTTIDDWRQGEDEIWREPKEDTEILALSGVVAAAVVAIGSLTLVTLTLIVPALLIGG